jgi:tetratricopeptide (TPR) repeat protein/transcriptional regulator with XRE-family HTH domain
MQIGEKIYLLRAQRGWRQGDLAGKADLDTKSISRYERHITYPDSEALGGLAAAFDITVDDLLCDTDPSRQRPARIRVERPRPGQPQAILLDGEAPQPATLPDSVDGTTPWLATQGALTGQPLPLRPEDLDRSSPAVFGGVPPRMTSFTGREDALERLHDILLGTGKPAAVTQAGVGRVALQGLGGIGKTSLAIEYAHRFRDCYAGVWWCPAETRTGLLTSLSTLAPEIGAISNRNDIETAAQATLWRLANPHAPWLLVYDNVTTPDAIRDLLPGAGARVLITSRFSDWGNRADEVVLDVMTPEEAVAFLQKRAGRPDDMGAGPLAEALGHLPLALDHAAAYCRRTQMRFIDYAAKAASMIATAPRGTAYPMSVTATFDLAITAAVDQCATAEDVMAFLAYGAPKRMLLLLVEAAVGSEEELRSALAALAEVSLLRHDPFEDGSPAVTVHRLVQAVARARAEAKGVAAVAITRLIDSLAAYYPYVSTDVEITECWPLCAVLSPHVLALRDTDPDGVAESDNWAELLHRTGGYFFSCAAYAQAEPLLRKALLIRQTTLGPEHPDTVSILNNLTMVLLQQSDLSGARQLAEHALAICEKGFGPEHPDTATSLTNLVVVLREQGAFARACPLAERALVIRKKAFGPSDPRTAQALNNLGNLLRQTGDLARARPFIEEALAIYLHVFKFKTSPAIATIIDNFASFLVDDCDFVEARSWYELTLTIREKKLGPEHPDTAISLHNLATVLRKQGDPAAARPLAQRALEIDEKALGSHHPTTNLMRRHFAQLLVSTGNFSEALRLSQIALAAHENALGPSHSWTKDSARVTADALDALTRADEAASLRARYGLDVA